jgi:multisubunit Na+/H+ antiporter MnhG subunit
MIYLTASLVIISSILLLVAAIAFAKAKDVFMMVQVTKITNIYIIPLLLIAIWLDKFSLLSLAKILVLIILNIIITNLICYAIVRKAVTNKISPDSGIIKS